jgi:hypothetical protein
MLMGKTIGVGGAPITLDMIGKTIDDGFEAIKFRVKWKRRWSGYWKKA